MAVGVTTDCELEVEVDDGASDMESVADQDQEVLVDVIVL